MKLFTNFSKFSISEIISIVILGSFWIILATQLSADEYGEIQFFLGVAAISSGISIFGSGSSLTILLAKKLQIQSSIIIISFIAGTFSAITIFLIFNKLEISLLIFGVITYNLGIYILQGKQEYNKYLYYNIFQKIIFISLAEISIFLNFEQIILALSISQFIYFPTIIKNIKLNEINLILIKRKINFLSHNYGLTIISIIKENMDKMLIFPILGSSILGNYSLALQAILILTGFITIINRYTLPLIAKGENVTYFFKFSYITIIPLFLVAFFIFPILIENILSQYVQSIDAIRILSLSIPFYIIGVTYQTRFIALEKMTYVTFGNMIFITSISLGMIVLGTNFGIIGISITYVFSVAIQSIFYFSLRKKLDIIDNMK